jgi:uroporphyrinogen decarboxylase
VPVHAIGFGVDIKAGVGPIVEHPFRRAGDLERLRPLEPDVDTPWVQETIRLLVGELDIPLIGFAGAPFTVASYLIEGRPSRDYALTKQMMYADPVTFAALLDRLAELAATSLRAQIDAGVSAVQLFDSWAGALSPEDYRRHVQPATAKVFAALDGCDVPRIHFGVGTAELLGLMADTGADVVGVDWRTPLDRARDRLGAGVALQGNLDPAVCLAPWPVVEEHARAVLAAAGDQPGHIFNLGHGVLPQTDPDVLARLVELVHTS